MSIIRTVHNRENPFVQLNKAALREENLSFKAKGLWAHCMSYPDNWKFNITHLSEVSKEGKRAIYSGIQELIDAGYAIRIESYEKSSDGKFKAKSTDYAFFEFRLTDEERKRYIEEFKKSFRERGFGDLRDGDLRNAPLLIKKEKDIDREENISPVGGAPAAPVPAAKAAPEAKIEDIKNVDLFIERLRVKKPDINIPKNLKKWRDEMRKIREVDGRTSDRIIRVINWLCSSDCKFEIWSPSSLREKFDRVEFRMQNPLVPFNAPKSRAPKQEIDVKAVYGW